VSGDAFRCGTMVRSWADEAAGDGSSIVALTELGITIARP
jgi:hypothetical protein